MPAVTTFVPKPLPRADLDWRALVPSIGRATLALARYDGILHGVPDPGVLLSPSSPGNTAALPASSRCARPAKRSAVHFRVSEYRTPCGAAPAPTAAAR